MKPKLKDLPFDQYCRQKIVADMVNTLRSNDKFSILDVGGYKGKTKEFLADDHVTVLDIFYAKDKDYIRGDGTNLHLKDQTFDFVVSFDVLEHISKKDRQRFIKECIRVSKRGFFLCFPFEGGSQANTNAEKSLNDIYKQLKESSHPWLKEHIDNGLPTVQGIEKILKDTKLPYTKLFSNKLENWYALQMIFFLSDVLNVNSIEAGKLNRYYNEHFEKFENQTSVDNAYRVIYFISTDNQLVSKANKYLDTLNKTISSDQLPLIIRSAPAITEIISKKVAEIIREKNDNIAVLNKVIEQLEDKQRDIDSSLSWRITKPLRATNAVMKWKKKD